MDIFDREWCNLYVWTPAGGSGLYHIPRDRAYWANCFAVLADFWCGALPTCFRLGGCRAVGAGRLLVRCGPCLQHSCGCYLAGGLGRARGCCRLGAWER